MSGLTTEDRRAWERDLIAHYLDELRTAGGTPPEFDEAWLQCRQQVFHGLAFLLITIGAGRLQPDMQPVEISKANLERMTHAVIDLDSFAALNETTSPPPGRSRVASAKTCKCPRTQVAPRPGFECCGAGGWYARPIRGGVARRLWPAASSSARSKKSPLR